MSISTVFQHCPIATPLVDVILSLQQHLADMYSEQFTRYGEPQKHDRLAITINLFPAVLVSI